MKIWGFWALLLSMTRKSDYMYITYRVRARLVSKLAVNIIRTLPVLNNAVGIPMSAVKRADILSH